MVRRDMGTIDAECLSALVDGEIELAESTAACEAWRLDEATRATWHSYQLIGDVLRSDDLASDAAHDCSFLIAVRGRLAHEAIVLAPRGPAEGAPSATASFAHESLTVVSEPRASTSALRSAWLIPSAVTAGFVLVVGTFGVLRSDAPSSAMVAAVDRVALPRTAAANSGRPTPVAVASANGPVLRDARLDRYLEAHKQFAGSSVLGAPSAFLRSATLDSSAR